MEIKKQRISLNIFFKLIIMIIFLVGFVSASVTWPVQSGKTLTADMLNYLHTWDKGSGDDVYHISGKVGIGTANPSAALDVVGTTKTTRLCIKDECKDFWPEGLGASVPSTGECNGHILARSGGVTIFNNRIAIYYADATSCPPCQTVTIYDRYYFGRGEWSNCIEKQVGCECVAGG